MPKVTGCKARVVVNSRGEKTIEAEVYIGDVFGRYAAPSGLSKGTFEAPPFPRGGLTEAVKLVQEDIAPKFVGFEFSSQREVDDFLRRIDGTENYSKIGGATAVSISIATAEAAAKSLGIPLYQWIAGDKKVTRLPIPLGNIVGGGKHSLGRASDIQEFLAAPLNAKSYKEGIFSLISLHEKVGELLAERDQFFLGGRNDEGA